MTLTKYLPIMSAVNYAQSGQFAKDLEHESSGKTYMTYKAMFKLMGHLYYGLAAVGLVVGASNNCWNKYTRCPPTEQQAAQVRTLPDEARSYSKNLEQKLIACHNQEQP